MPAKEGNEAAPADVREDMTDEFVKRLRDIGLSDVANNPALWVPFIVTLAGQPGVLLDCGGGAPSTLRVGVLAVWDIVYGRRSDPKRGQVETIYLVAAVQAVNLMTIGAAPLPADKQRDWARIAVPPLWRSTLVHDTYGGYSTAGSSHQYALPQQYIPLIELDGRGTPTVHVCPMDKETSDVYGAHVAPYEAVRLLQQKYGFVVNSAMVPNTPTTSINFVGASLGGAAVPPNHGAQLRTSPIANGCTRLAALLYFGFVSRLTGSAVDVTIRDSAGQEIYVQRARLMASALASGSTPKAAKFGKIDAAHLNGIDAFGARWTRRAPTELAVLVPPMEGVVYSSTQVPLDPHFFLLTSVARMLKTDVTPMTGPWARFIDKRQNNVALAFTDNVDRRGTGIAGVGDGARALLRGVTNNQLGSVIHGGRGLFTNMRDLKGFSDRGFDSFVALRVSYPRLLRVGKVDTVKAAVGAMKWVPIAPMALKNYDDGVVPDDNKQIDAYSSNSAQPQDVVCAMLWKDNLMTHGVSKAVSSHTGPPLLRQQGVPDFARVNVAPAVHGANATCAGLSAPDTCQTHSLRFEIENVSYNLALNEPLDPQRRASFQEYQAPAPPGSPAQPAVADRHLCALTTHTASMRYMGPPYNLGRASRSSAAGNDKLLNELYAMSEGLQQLDNSLVLRMPALFEALMRKLTLNSLTAEWSDRVMKNTTALGFGLSLPAVVAKANAAVNALKIAPYLMPGIVAILNGPLLSHISQIGAGIGPRAVAPLPPPPLSIQRAQMRVLGAVLSACAFASPTPNPYLRVPGLTVACKGDNEGFPSSTILNLLTYLVEASSVQADSTHATNAKVKLRLPLQWVNLKFQGTSARNVRLLIAGVLLPIPQTFTWYTKTRTELSAPNVPNAVHDLAQCVMTIHATPPRHGGTVALATALCLNLADPLSAPRTSGTPGSTAAATDVAATIRFASQTRRDAFVRSVHRYTAQRDDSAEAPAPVFPHAGHLASGAPASAKPASAPVGASFPHVDHFGRAPAHSTAASASPAPPPAHEPPASGTDHVLL